MEEVIDQESTILDSIQEKLDLLIELHETGDEGQLADYVYETFQQVQPNLKRIYLTTFIESLSQSYFKRLPITAILKNHTYEEVKNIAEELYPDFFQMYSEGGEYYDPDHSLSKQEYDNEFARYLTFNEDEQGGGTYRDLSSLLIEEYGDPEFQFHFIDYWNIVKNISYHRITDGEPLGILEFAKVWLYDRINDLGSKLGEALDLSANDEELSYKLIKKVLDKEIKPVLEEEVSTSIKFIQRDFINSAKGLDNEIAVGLKAQASKITGFSAIIAEFSDLEPQIGFDWEVKNATYAFDIRRSNETLSLEYMNTIEQDIFDSVIVSGAVPLCILNLTETKIKEGLLVAKANRWFKAHIGHSTDFEKYEKDVMKNPNIKVRRGTKAKGINKNKWLDDSDPLTLVMYVYAGEGNPETAPKKDFVRVVYSFRRGMDDFNKLVCVLPNFNIDLIKTRINEALTKFQLVDYDRHEQIMINVKQEFVVPDVELDEDLFMHLVSTTDTTAILLRFPENDMPWTQKSQLKFGMFLFGDIKISIKNSKVINSSLFVKQKGLPRALLLNDKYVRITITSQDFARGDIARFIILRLFQSYQDKYDDLLNLYRLIQSNRARIEPIKETRGREVTFDETATVAKRLAQINPDLWEGSQYPRRYAQKPDLQVMPIKESEIQFYLDQGRDVIRWPDRITNLPAEMQSIININEITKLPVQHYYTTATLQKPHIKFTRNKGDKSDIYPLLPKAQQSSTGLVVNADWSITIPQKIKTRPDESLKTVRTLKPGQPGELGKELSDFLQLPNCTRFGMWPSKSSLLHCLLYTTDNDFRTYASTQRAEETVREARIKLGSLEYYAQLCKQENPDKSLEEISAALSDPNVYLDPNLYYRALEDLFEVNIFIFSATIQRKNFVIQPPNYESPYIRLKRKFKATVLISYLIPSSLSEIPQCELIYSRQFRNNGYIFEGTIADRLSSVVASLTQTIAIRPATVIQNNDGIKTAVTNMTIEISKDRILELPIEFEPIVPNQDTQSRSRAIGQWIDSRGKLRGITLSINKRKIYVITEPLEPLRLPIIKPRTNSYNSYLELVQFLPLTNIMYTPKEGKLVGVWATVGGRGALADTSSLIRIYIPVVTTNWQPAFHPVKFEIGYMPENSSTESETQALIRLQKVAIVYIQVIKRLYVKSGLSVEDFVINHTISIPGHKLNVDGGSRSIPVNATTFDLLLDHFVRTFPNLFEDNRIIFDAENTEIFAIERLNQFQIIRDQQVAATRTANIPGNSDRVDNFPPFLNHIYETVDDFTKHTRNQMVFMSLDRFKLEKQISLDSSPLIVQYINNSYSLRKSPFFYLHEGKKLYMIQNVKRGIALAASTVAKFWHQNKINTGYHTKGVASMNDVVIIPLTLANLNNVEENSVTILDYGENGYAALMRV